MFQASFKIQSAGAIILAVIWATTAVAPAQGQAKHEEIAIGYASPSGVMTPLYVAQEQGLFKKYGIGVKELLLLRGTGPAAAQMLVAGTAPIAALGGALVEAAIRGAGIAYIASTSNHLTFSIYSRWEITRPEDLSGG
jgi:ABC-type nitrate/sulfonate/bicarbonate transport system substrate-binding protein